MKQRTHTISSIYRVFFYFGLFDMPIIWSFFGQKLSSWTFFISIFRSYFVKKIQNYSAITYFFMLFLENVPIWVKFSKFSLFLAKF
jgi:hypothetical protein